MLTMAPRERLSNGRKAWVTLIGAEEVDGEKPFDRGTIAQVIVKRYAGVVDEDIERSDVSRPLAESAPRWSRLASGA